MNIKNFFNDDGPKNVFIYYSFLLLDRDTNELIVTNRQELRKVFVEHYRKDKKRFTHLEKDVWRGILDDIVKSYFYIKENYLIV